MTLPDEALDREVLVRMTVRELLAWQGRASKAGPGHEVGTDDAARILQRTPREVRALAVRWLKMQSTGRVPPVRVSRTSDAANAHWRFDEGDLTKHAARRGGPKLVTGTDPNDADAIASRLYAAGE